MWTKLIFHWDFDQKIANFLETFRNFFIIGPKAQGFPRRDLTFPCPMEIILQMLSFDFLQISVYFFQIFREFSSHFQYSFTI